MKKKTAAMLAGLLPLALFLAACSGGGEAGGGEADGGGIFGYSSPVGAQPGQQQIGEGIEGAVSEAGRDSKILDANLSVDKQVSDLQTLIQLGATSIGLWALDENALRSSYEQAKSQGVSLVGLNSESDAFDGSVWWQTHTCSPGGPAEQTVDYIEQLKPGAKVIVFGGPPVPSITSTVKCFSEAAEAGGLEIVNQTDNTNDDSASAATMMSDLLLQYPDVDAVWSYNDASALGASSAIIQSGGTVYDGSNDGVVVIGINADADAIDAVRQGRLTGTWDPNPPATGWALVQASQLIEAGDSADLVVEATLWTRENLEDYVVPEERIYTLDTIPLVD